MATKRRSLSLKEKIKLIETASQENRCNVRALALKFGVGKSQVSEILKNRDTILKLSSESGCSMKKFGMSLKVDDKVFRWFRSALANGVSVSGPLLKAKAKDVAGHLGYYNFKASNGWLHRFRLRHGIICKAVLGSDQTVMDNLFPSQTMAQVQPPEQNVGSGDFLQMDLSPSQDLEDISHSLGTPSLLRERNVKRSKEFSEPNPGPSSSQTCVANESTELIVVKEEPMSFEIDDMSNYNMTFVDVNQHETILAETFETPERSRAESLFEDRKSQQSLVNPSGQELETNGRQLQSAQLAEYALYPNSLTSSSQNITSKRKKSEGNGKREYLTSCETSKTETEIRLHMVKLEVEQMREEHVTKMANLQRKMDIQLDQMKKEHESNMANLQRKMNIQLDQMKKEHESNMANLQTKMDIQHEAKMKEHEIKMIELTGKTDQIRLKNEEIKKKMELDGTISELTIKKLREKINAIIMKREQVTQAHELTVQGLKQKLNNSYLENQILKMKQDGLEK